jgi:hypothetical protein
MATPHQTGKDSYLHVQDCRIWAEISYLDSPTDYRECLQTVCPDCQPGSSGLMMLDTSANSAGKRFGKPLLFLVGIVTLLTCGYLLFSFWTEL